MTYERFVDRQDRKQLIKNSGDFILRRHGLPPSWVVYAFIIVLLTILIMVNYLSFTLINLPNNAPTPLNEILTSLVIISILLTGVAFFAYSMAHKIHEIILFTEFQNLLFSSAASVDTKFCAILNKDKVMVYYDYNFHEIFLNDSKNKSTFERFITSKHIDGNSKDVFVDAIETSTKETLSINISSENGSEEVRVAIDPLKRPVGHVVIRGYSA